MPVRPETSKRQNRFKIERNMLEEEVVKKFYGENELRRMYLEFFESKGHLKMNSFSLVPHNDNSLLLINAYSSGNKLRGTVFPDKPDLFLSG